MAHNYGTGFTDTHHNQKEFSEKFSGSDSGPYIGIVKNTIDPTRMGRLGVLIPDLANVPDSNRDSKKVIWCQYLSPFYGVKPFESVSKTDPYSHKTSQSSYGLWAVPPDIGTNVLVIFAKGERGQKSAFWIGCIQEPLTNQMIPGNASSEKSAIGVESVGEFDQHRETSESTKQAEYGTNVLPVGEKNRHVAGTTSIDQYDLWKYPVNVDLANQLMTEGLIEDAVRGTTTSSARRESPSSVFGISTPGRIRKDTRKPNIGLEGTPVEVDRAIGHSLVMDDGDYKGNNQLTRLRTSSGHQLLMNDTAGVIYIANGSGNAWIEMNKEGRIDIYSRGGINLRSEKDFNLHSDTNVNIHAGQSIRMKAKNEIINSSDYLLNLGSNGVLTSSTNGAIRDFANQGISSYTAGQQLHGAAGGTHLAGGQIHFNSVGASNSWGPHWMNNGAVGMTASEEPDIELAQKGIKPLELGTRKTETTVHRFVTHEPMPRWEGFAEPDLIPIDSDDKKRWSQLSSTPGTKEYIAQLNRLSEIEAIRDAQYQADALAFIKQKMIDSTNPNEAKAYLTEFGLNYDKTFNIVSQVGNAWDTANTISNKIKNFNISDAKHQIKDHFQTKLTNQVVENLTSSATKMFKDSVFVNQAGDIFTLGGINQTANIQTITSVYKNIIGGKTTNLTQITKLASKFSLGNTARLSPGALGGKIPLRSIIGTKMNAVGSWVNQGIAAVSSFFSGWSDVRLKEDIQLVGKSPSGINIYRFKYKHTDGTYQGVMAQEVPQARQMTDTGFYMVDYSKLDVDFRRLN